MDESELRELLTPEGLQLLSATPAPSSKDDVVQRVTQLRKQGHSPSLVAAVLSQARLRDRAKAKFGDFAESMLFTQAGLEQATRLPVAARHAGRFQAAGLHRVADLGCGIGADAMAMAALELEVLAVERDEVTAAIAAFNLAPWPAARVVNGSAEQAQLDGIEGVYLDPARRSERGRLRDPADWSPSLDFAFDLAKRLPTGVKLGSGIDRGLIPDEAEAQWVSVDHEVVELGLWFGALARPGVRRAALVLGSHGAAELTASGDAPDAEAGPLGSHVFEPDGSVIRARLIGDLARSLDARMLHPTIAYLTADEPAGTPFASCFRVIADLALDERTLRRELAARGIGTLEIKKRGVDVDPAQLRKSLALRGDGQATLMLTRVGQRRRALLLERV